MDNMLTLEKQLENVDRVYCSDCSYWFGKWAASFDENLKFICPKCIKEN